ncbi:hypothetical protein BT96DRAFT_77141 [Gymnopus androsaceus JB14]|uniref:Uncharacterized protein n=1 Tax=Gymnopus androsaceus JB14 TaxID=1447944 RepID=A0A6A4HI33_9AGAR|nr:hypothetical protein BT96DRAFT_77141 [Gymnopus androsaceus JB14]
MSQKNNGGLLAESEGHSTTCESIIVSASAEQQGQPRSGKGKEKKTVLQQAPKCNDPGLVSDFNTATLPFHLLFFLHRDSLHHFKSTYRSYPPLQLLNVIDLDSSRRMSASLKLCRNGVKLGIGS